MRALVLFLGFASAFLATPARCADQTIDRDDFFCDKGALALRVGKSLRDLRLLGTVLNETVEAPYPDGTETRVLVFDGLKIQVVFPQKNYEAAMFERVEITSPSWGIAAGVRVGSTVKQLSTAIKAKIRPGIGSISVCGEGDCAVYSLKGSRVTAINYRCYTG